MESETDVILTRWLTDGARLAGRLEEMSEANLQTMHEAISALRNMFRVELEIRRENDEPV